MVAPIEMRLADVCFAHWPVDPGEMTAHVPEGTTVDTRDGQAWLSVVGMQVRPRFLSADGAYGQVNVRTYLTGDRPADPTDDQRAVYFLDAIADEWLAVGGARILTDVSLSYGSVSVDRNQTGIDVRCEASGSGRFEMHLVPTGRPKPVEDGSLAHWLAERYRFIRDDGTMGAVDHGPWRLQPAMGQVTRESLLADLPEPTGDAAFHYSPGVLVEA